jgi:hypothetical protein
MFRSDSLPFLFRAPNPKSRIRYHAAEEIPMVYIFGKDT